MYRKNVWNFLYGKFLESPDPTVLKIIVKFKEELKERLM
jgi:hypothetical protein